MLSAGEIERWIWRVFKRLDAFRLDDLMICLFFMIVESTASSCEEQLVPWIWISGPCKYAIDRTLCIAHCSPELMAINWNVFVKCSCASYGMHETARSQTCLCLLLSFQALIWTQYCGKKEKSVLGQRAESRLDCGINSILGFLVFWKVSIL